MIKSFDLPILPGNSLIKFTAFPARSFAFLLPLNKSIKSALKSIEITRRDSSFRAKPGRRQIHNVMHACFLARKQRIHRNHIVMLNLL